MPSVPDGWSLDLARPLMGQEAHASVYKDPAVWNSQFWLEMGLILWLFLLCHLVPRAHCWAQVHGEARLIQLQTTQ